MICGQATYGRQTTLKRHHVASIIGRSEAQVEQLVREDSTFPRPTIKSGEPHWYRNEVLAWKNIDWLREPRWSAS